MSNETILWIIFGVVVAGMMALELGVFQRKAHALPFREALAWTGAWIALAMGYLGLIAVLHRDGTQKALEFLTGYVVEESLSVDNLFVFMLILAYFAVPSQYQHNALFWGILGAIVLRVVFIVAGVTLIQKFHWLLYLFGAILVVSGIKMGIEEEKEIDPNQNPVLRLFRRFVPVTPAYEGRRLFVRRDGRWHATPLCVVLLVLATTDIVFAVDSIPAVLSITQDPFIVCTSNVFAVMGLRALFFVLAGAMNLFSRLHYGLCAVLVFIGAKMLVSRWVEIPIVVALSVVIGVLAASILASLIWPAREKPRPPGSPGPGRNSAK